MVKVPYAFEFCMISIFDFHIFHQKTYCSRTRVKARVTNNQRLSKASASKTGDDHHDFDVNDDDEEEDEDEDDGDDSDDDDGNAGADPRSAPRF